MLLAQSAGTNTNAIWLGGLIVAAVAVSLLAFILVLVLLLRHFRANRHLLHAERMRSIEAGFSLDAPHPTDVQAKHMHHAFWISFWIVFGVPTAAFSAASAVTKEINGNLGLGIAIWVGAAVASVAAVVCATVLMTHSRTGRNEESGRIQRPLKPQ